MTITQSTAVLVTRGPVQWRGQLLMRHVYIMYIYFPMVASKYLNCARSPGEIVQNLNKFA